jgi:tetratricopeptide (TPR) repeat protein
MLGSIPQLFHDGANPPRGTRRVFGALLFCALAAAVAYAYATSLPVGFVFDDTYGIVQNPSVRTLANIPRYFVDPFLLTTLRDNVDVRPILQVTFAINYAISKYAPWSWRLFNILVHVITAMLVFRCVRDHCWWPREERGPDGFARWPAASAALIFALSPLNHQAVVYMWARSALLCTCFYVGAFLVFIEKRYKLSAFLFLLALLTKTIAVTLPLMVVVYDFFENDGLKNVRVWARGLWKRLGKPWALLVAVLIAFMVYRAAILPSWADATRHAAWVTPRIWLMSQWSAYLYYVRLFLWPDALSIDHDFGYNVTLFTARTLLSLAGVLGWLWLALKLGRKHTTFAFATAWYFITLAPESTLSPLAEVINDHRPYLASTLGLSLLFSWTLCSVAKRLTSRPQVALTAAVLVLAAAAVPVVRHRNWLWQDDMRLWMDTAEKNPGNGRAAMNAGQGLMAHGRFKEARAYFDRALKLAPAYSFLHMNLSVLESAEGNRAKSLSEAQLAVQLSPDLAIAHQFLGQALERVNKLTEARAELERALQLEPRLTDAQQGLRDLDAQTDPGAAQMREGLDALYQRNDPGAAVLAFARVLSQNAQHYGANYQMAVALDRLGRSAEAEPLWQRVLLMAQSYNDAQTAQTARARLRLAQ